MVGLVYEDGVDLTRIETVTIWVDGEHNIDTREGIQLRSFENATRSLVSLDILTFGLYLCPWKSLINYIKEQLKIKNLLKQYINTYTILCIKDEKQRYLKMPISVALQLIVEGIHGNFSGKFSNILWKYVNITSITLHKQWCFYNLIQKYYLWHLD